jgi:uncharacterized protein YeaO (DUF488 family)
MVARQVLRTVAKIDFFKEGGLLVKLKRIYELAEKKDGYRILVDRLWPRGIKKTAAAVDEWAKEIAPSTVLRKQFDHKPEKWNWFRSHYKAELRARSLREKIAPIAKRAARSTVTLLYGARDEKYNQAVVLKEVLDRMLKTATK